MFLPSARNEVAFSNFGSPLICGSPFFRKVLYEGFDMCVSVLFIAWVMCVYVVWVYEVVVGWLGSGCVDSVGS